VVTAFSAPSAPKVFGNRKAKPMTDARWLATINYITDAGVLPVEHDIEELGEIEEIVEHGPDWSAIESIVIRQQGGTVIPPSKRRVSSSGARSGTRLIAPVRLSTKPRKLFARDPAIAPGRLRPPLTRCGPGVEPV
jgi:hypothetical protein